MKKIVFLFCLLFLLVGFCQTASALPYFNYGENELYYRNYESVFRNTDTNGDGKLDTYVELDYSNPDNLPQVQEADIFVGIISVQNITQQGSGIWSVDDGVEELTGIFAQEITTITANTSNLTIDLGFASESDFTTLSGKTFSTGLASNEMMKIYLDADTNGDGSNTSQFSVNTTIVGDIANATDGEEWMTLGYDGAAVDNEYAWSLVTPHGTSLDAFAGNSYLGLTILDYYYGLGGVGTPLLNDTGEARYDNDVQFYANSELEGHDGYLKGWSEWSYQSNDPAVISTIPEPATMFLFGFGLLGFAFTARTRRRLV